MSDIVMFEPLSLADVFCLRDVKVYEYDSDLILTVGYDGSERLVHLYENEIDGRVMYAISKGQIAPVDREPLFIGNPESIEIYFAGVDKEWDFKSLSLKGRDSSLLKIVRNDESFPEPTFMKAS